MHRVFGQRVPSAAHDNDDDSMDHNAAASTSSSSRTKGDASISSFQRSFSAWQSRCHSAMQPSPSRRTTPVQTFFPLRSVAEQSSNSAEGTKASGNSISSTSARSSWDWGWLRGNNSKEGTHVDVSPAAAAAVKNRSSDQGTSMRDAVFGDLFTQLEPEQETDIDRGQREMCERYCDKLLRTSPMVRFMVKQLALVGCSPVDADGSIDRIVIGKCQGQIAGGFMPSTGNAPRSHSGLLICYNGIIDKKHMENTMAHEMLHWFDHCRFKANWSDLRHVACSEIRAASLSGDCKFMREFSRGQIGFRKHHQVCVRRRAIISVEANPECPDKATAERTVDEVWESCFSDTRPFDEIY